MQVAVITGTWGDANSEVGITAENVYDALIKFDTLSD
jgi:hypothetical protein